MSAARRGALWVAWLAAILSMSMARRAGADDAPSVATDTAPRRVVRIVIASDDQEAAAALEGSLRELLARLDLTVEASRAERLDLEDPASLTQSSQTELATAWVDLRAARATTVLVEGRSGRVVAHRSVARDRSTAIVVEELAHILQASVEELADAERRRPPPRAAPEAPPGAAREPMRVAPPAGPSKWGVDGGGFFGGRGFGAGAEAVIGGGGMVGAALGRDQLRPALWLIGTYHVAFDVRGRLVDVHAKALAMRLAPTLKLLGGERWMIEAGPEGGFDVMWTAPRANSSGLPAGRLGDESMDVSPVVGALVAAHFAVGRTADLLVAFAADVDLSPHRFVVLEGQETEPLFTPWRVRPALIVGFTFTLGGSAPYPSPEEPR